MDVIDGQWFHGSPEKLTVLRAGSWVTPFKELAKAFSHKPTCISISDDDFRYVRHEGKIDGYLYVISEPLSIGDLRELSGTDQSHWETIRELKIKFVSDVPLLDSEMLSEPEIAALLKKHSGPGYWSTKNEDQ